MAKLLAPNITIQHHHPQTEWTQLDTFMILPFSRINLPSLYFCDSSTALTCPSNSNVGQPQPGGTPPGHHRHWIVDEAVN